MPNSYISRLENNSLFSCRQKSHNVSPTANNKKKLTINQRYTYKGEQLTSKLVGNSNFVKLKSLGVSDTSRTLDTRNKKRGNDSSTSLLDKLTPKEKEKLFNMSFIRES